MAKINSSIILTFVSYPVVRMLFIFLVFTSWILMSGNVFLLKESAFIKHTKIFKHIFNQNRKRPLLLLTTGVCNAFIMFYRVQTWTAQIFWGRYISQIALKHHDYLVNFTEWRTIYTDRDPIALLHKSLIKLIQQISESHAQSIKIGNLSFWRKVPKNIAKRATNVTTLSFMSK